VLKGIQGGGRPKGPVAQDVLRAAEGA